MNFTRVKIVTFVPVEDSDKIRQVLGEKGAGIISNYAFCSFSSRGSGRFTPSKDANPHIGQINKPEVVNEERIEVVCDRDKAKSAIKAMKEAHPYEEVAFDIYPLVEEGDL